MLINFFRFIAEETRELLAALGVRSLKDLIGRVDLLEILPGETERQQHLNLKPLLESHPDADGKAQYCEVQGNAAHDKGLLAEEMVKDMLPSIENCQGGEFYYTVGNCNRSIGARLSGEIAKRHGNLGMSNAPVTLKLQGTAGQSLGVWNAGGLHIKLEGDANDYVGKGMAGGRVSIFPPKGSPFQTQETAIIGNTCLYGATGGKLFAAGTAGERFGVRNSGAFAVIEGAGDHCCEYMTGGIVTVLGKVGHNFGAGMTGGFAYVLDLDNDFVDYYNHELIDLTRISTESMEEHQQFLMKILDEHIQETGSAWAYKIRNEFDYYSRKFWLVKPKAANLLTLLKTTQADPQ